MAAVQRRIRPNGHAHRADRMEGEAQCPYCGQSITRREYTEIQARIETEERVRIVKIEADLKAGAAREVAKAQIEARAAIEKVRKEVTKSAEAKVKAVRDNQEVTIAARLQTQREAADKKLAEAVNAEKVKAFDEKAALTSQLADMQRRLERKTAHELGEPAEANLFGAITAACSVDMTARRVAKGRPGPDIIVEVMHGGALAGRVIIDSKNHKRWSNAFVSKLRSDQHAEGADFAILSTAVFPKGVRQLHVQDSVIIADPSRVVALLDLLRRVIVTNHVLRLSSEARSEKADELYSFILSPACTDMFDRLKKAADDLIDLEVKEVDAHHGVWRKRGELIRVVQHVHEELGEAVSRIIGGDDAAPIQAEREVAA